ncbi:TPA: type IV secretion protein IcmC [Legionella anisa]
MNTPDFITMIGNLSHSLYPVQHLITGGAYLLGILFFMTAISKLRKIADHRSGSSSQEKMFSPMMYLVMGAALLYLPTALDIMANTTFGAGNILTYTSYNSSNIFSSMGLVVQTAGVLWFVRGCVLVAQASQPGTQHGPKGLAFMIAGVFAMNFDNSIAMLNYVMNSLTTWTMAIKTSQGY